MSLLGEVEALQRRIEAQTAELHQTKPAGPTELRRACERLAAGFAQELQGLRQRCTGQHLDEVVTRRLEELATRLSDYVERESKVAAVPGKLSGSIFANALRSTPKWAQESASVKTQKCQACGAAQADENTVCQFCGASFFGGEGR